MRQVLLLHIRFRTLPTLKPTSAAKDLESSPRRNNSILRATNSGALLDFVSLITVPIHATLWRTCQAKTLDSFHSALNASPCSVKSDLNFEPEILGATLRDVRLALGVGIRQLARGSGVSPSQILRIESGEFDCFVSSIIRLCAPFGIRLSELLERCAIPNYELYATALEAELLRGYPPEFPSDDPSQKALKDLVLGGAVIFSYLLRAARPELRSAEFHYPSSAIEDRFTSIAVALANNPPALTSRSTFLEFLTTVPLKTLRQYYGYPTLEDVAAHIGNDRPPHSRRFYPWIPMYVFPIKVRPLSAEDFEDPKNVLTEITLKSNQSAMSNPLSKLTTRLKRVTQPRGKKAELAVFMGVKYPRISEWLSGRKEPGGNATLRLLEWVAAQEAKQTKSPGDVEASPERATRRRKSSYEKSKSNRKKR